ncbi:MAG: hypothetical protein PHT51_00375 [Patescibacteria group bacterium]|nr:hypothetical protein [Patescibacteria group bacterium]MDD4611050.1 hypothetical protein [Patescibacteria group bacterium]
MKINIKLFLEALNINRKEVSEVIQLSPNLVKVVWADGMSQKFKVSKII